MKSREKIRYYVTEPDGIEHPVKTKQEAQIALDDGKHVVERKRILSYTTNSTIRLNISTHYHVGETIE